MAEEFEGQGAGDLVDYDKLDVLPARFEDKDKNEHEQQRVVELLRGKQEMARDNYVAFLESLPPDTPIYRGSNHDSKRRLMAEDWTFIRGHAVTHAKRSAHENYPREKPSLIVSSSGQLATFIKDMVDVLNGGLDKGYLRRGSYFHTNSFVGQGNSVFEIKIFVPAHLEEIKRIKEREPDARIPKLPVKTYRVPKEPPVK